MKCKSKEGEKTHKIRSPPSLKMAPENVLRIIPSFSLLVVDVDVMCPSNSPAMAPENVLDGNNYVTTLGLQVQSAVASFFSPQGWLEGLYRTLGELAKDCSFLHFKQFTKQIKSPCVPNSTKWLSSTRCLISKANNNNIKCNKVNYS